MLLSLILATTTAVAAPEASTYVNATIALPQVAGPIAIDGTTSNSAWQKATTVNLGWNLRDQQPADQPTTARIMTDGKYIYVAFDAKQRQPIQAAQHTDNQTLTNDDYVSVYFWPNGANGFSYGFTVNPRGTHVQSSSENTAYAPSWQSAGRIGNGAYTVTMRIPMDAIKGGGGTWRLQFTRYIASSLDDYVWQHSPELTTGNDASVLYSGLVTGVPSTRIARPKPRLGIYELGALASKSIGGSTTRVGADLSIPITDKTSFVATFHPDYSNVELDQQTIVPTAYQRQFSEVRPFFTQLANYYNNDTCIGCTAQELYTPSIPTPRAGYAFEGKQGPVSFAAFDVPGIDGRNDNATAVSLHTNDSKTSLFLQRVGVTLPNFFDTNTLVSLSHDSLQGMFEYVTFGSEAGTLVTDGADAKRREAGVGVYNRNGGIYGAVRSIGSQYLPVDGYVQNTDIGGYDLNGNYTWYYNKNAFIPRFIVAANIDRYHGSDGALDQTDSSFAVGADFAKIWHIRLGTGSSYLRLNDGTFTPVSQNGIDLWYNYHTPTQTQLSWYTGRFGPGKVDAWTRLTTLHAGPRGFLSLEADDNVQWLDAGPRYVSWLEKATYTYENGSNSSFGFGVRRIIGQFPVVEGGVTNPYLNGWNLTATFYKRLPHAELYVVYGDANAFSTAPQFIVKLIEYLGAEKGT